MLLVDYSSSDSEDPSKPEASSAREPRSKKPKLALPAHFHDLYASTVRTFDAPSFHQGRHRQIPHVPGNWPSHVYIEWRPPTETYALLAHFISALRVRLSPLSASAEEEAAPAAAPETRAVRLESHLESELGVPRPLHISLSRLVVLSTREKDAFLRDLESRVNRSGRGGFTLRCARVEWHRTAESGRSFLVMRVASRRMEEDSASSASPVDDANPELTALLAACNASARSFGQSELYARPSPMAATTALDSPTWPATCSTASSPSPVGNAFHISIAWSFALPSAAMRRATRDVLATNRLGDKIWREVEVRVDSVKAKIGNVVTNIDLDADMRP